MLVAQKAKRSENVAGGWAGPAGSTVLWKPQFISKRPGLSSFNFQMPNLKKKGRRRSVESPPKSQEKVEEKTEEEHGKNRPQEESGTATQTLCRIFDLRENPRTASIPSISRPLVTSLEFSDSFDLVV